jgi:NADH-quinone oxidoreductase subunit M
MSDLPLLSLVTFLPAAGAALLVAARWMAGPQDNPGFDRGARWLALVVTLATLALSLVALANFDVGSAAFQLIERRTLIAGIE